MFVGSVNIYGLWSSMADNNTYGAFRTMAKARIHLIRSYFADLPSNFAYDDGFPATNSQIEDIDTRVGLT